MMVQKYSGEPVVGDIIRTLFPYSDKQKYTLRPALVLSPKQFNKSTNTIVVAMITKAQYSSWPFDTPITFYREAGLDIPSLVRFKLHTLEIKLIDKPLGTLSPYDMQNVHINLNKLFQGLHGIKPSTIREAQP